MNGYVLSCNVLSTSRRPLTTGNLNFSIVMFDVPYMIDRSKLHVIFSEFDKQGFDKYGHAKEKTISWSSSAYKNQSFQYLEAEGKKEGSGFVKPARVLEDTDKYHKLCDKYYEFIHENCVKTDEDKTENITILYENYKCWYKNAYMSRPENLNNLKEYLVKNHYNVQIDNDNVIGLSLVLSY